MRDVVVLSVDVEVWGDGRGDLFACVVIPLLRLAAVAEDAGARLVLFVEPTQLRARQAREPGPVGQVWSTLARLRSRGHELQLHLHPEWAGATWAGDRYRLVGPATVAATPTPQLADLLGQGLEQLRGETGGAPFVFRAGGYALGRDPGAIRALRQAGLWVDSSVAPGQALGPGADWREAPAARWWRFEDDPLLSAPQGPSWELPVLTGRLPLWRRAWETLTRPAPAPGCCGAPRASRRAALATGRQVRAEVGTRRPSSLLALLGAGPGPRVLSLHTKNVGPETARIFCSLLERLPAAWPVATFGELLGVPAV